MNGKLSTICILSFMEEKRETINHNMMYEITTHFVQTGGN
jgi:hypothetical protein